jgi:hypothetical protein
MTEVKNPMQIFNSRFDQVEERISELEDKLFEITSQRNKKKERKNNPAENLRHDGTSVCCGVPAGEDTETEENLLKSVTALNLPQSGDGNGCSNKNHT